MARSGDGISANAAATRTYIQALLEVATKSNVLEESLANLQQELSNEKKAGHVMAEVLEPKNEKIARLTASVEAHEESEVSVSQKVTESVLNELRDHLRKSEEKEERSRLSHVEKEKVVVAANSVLQASSALEKKVSDLADVMSAL